MSVDEYVDIDDLPGDRIDREGNDEVAAQAFTAACTAMGGPAAGGLCDWYTHGGAEWIQNAIMSVLPDSWKAQGVYDWFNLIDPIRTPAMQVWHAQWVAAEDSYRLLLEKKGLVKPNEKTPEYLLWNNSKYNKDTGKSEQVGVQRFIVSDPKPFYGFGYWVRKIADEKFGMNKFSDAMCDDYKQFVQLKSFDDCVAATGEDNWRSYFCVKLQGISQTPSENDLNTMADCLARVLATRRLDPFKKAQSLALDAASIAIDKAVKQQQSLYYNMLGNITLKKPEFVIQPITKKKPNYVAWGLGTVATLGAIVTGIYFWRFRK